MSALWSTLWRPIAARLPPPTMVFSLLTREKHTIKTNRSIAKRFRVRGDGTLKRSKSGKSHNTGYKTRARKNRLGQSDTIADKKLASKMKRCLGVS